ncbi:MAG: TetR/AcrR family transcriptional regulator [Anaerolineae bacterium]|nr:TetR/AcrR family transcriptional regulator [Anaerolineae bacterium]
MPRPKHSGPQPDMREMILDAAWKQIAETGASGLSLRAIARAMKITAPAIYNYFPDRDALVTAMVIAAYKSFGESQLAARDAVSSEDLWGRMWATGMAYRAWALRYPERYHLIFGAPIPGDVPLSELIQPSGAHSMLALVSIVEAFRVAGKLRTVDFPRVTPEFETAYQQWRCLVGDADILSITVALLVWARVHGLVSLEIARNIPPFGPNGDELYQYELQAIAREFFKE